MDKTLDDSNRESFCILPWIHMYVSPNGVSQPCCVNRPETSIVYGNVNENSWQEMWNSPEIRRFRLDLLQGKRRPDVCLNCYQAEANGAKSDRQRNNELYKELIPEVVPQTQDNGSVDRLRLYYWDFRFSNLCNLKCRTCGPMYSSRWKDDIEKAGQLDRVLVADLEQTRKGDYRQFLFEQMRHVRHIYFAGGEPLLSELHYEILEELIRRGRTDVILSYSSNATELEFRGKCVIDYWKPFSQIFYMASVDDVGARAEYLRKGTVWRKLVANIQRIRKESPHVYVSTITTVSIFNVLYLREIHQTLEELAFFPPGKPEEYLLNVLWSPEHLQASVLPRALRDDAVAELSEFQAELSRKSGKNLTTFDSVIRALQKDSSHELPTFLAMTKTWDRIRGEKFDSVYPRLAGLVTAVEPS